MPRVFRVGKPQEPTRLNYLVEVEKAKKLRELDAGRIKRKAEKKKRQAARKAAKAAKPKIVVLASVEKPRIQNKFHAIPYRQGMRSEFYSTQEWRSLRWRVLMECGAVCCVCGATKETSGRPLHVDHIKPRYKFPALELVRSNLQVLCEDCNLGKGGSY